MSAIHIHVHDAVKHDPKTGQFVPELGTSSLSLKGKEQTNKSSLSPEQRRRVERALVETKKSLEREMRYSPDLQEKSLVDHYHQHIKKLEGMLL